MNPTTTSAKIVQPPSPYKNKRPKSGKPYDKEITVENDSHDDEVFLSRKRQRTSLETSSPRNTIHKSPSEELRTPKAKTFPNGEDCMTPPVDDKLKLSEITPPPNTTGIKPYTQDSRTGVSYASEPANSPEHCGFCRKAATESSSLLVCTVCGNGGHQKCLRMTDIVWSRALASDSWKCWACQNQAALHSMAQTYENTAPSHSEETPCAKITDSRETDVAIEALSSLKRGLSCESFKSTSSLPRSQSLTSVASSYAESEDEVRRNGRMSLDSAMDSARNLESPDPEMWRSNSRGRKSSLIWTEAEDSLLMQAVKTHNGKNWKAIADMVGMHRSNIQCKHRWQKVLDPNLVKGPWSPEEDRQIVSLVMKYGPKRWSFIAKHLQGRTGKQCRERWVNQLDPKIKKEPWTAEEDAKLQEVHAKLGNKWAEIAKSLPGRSENAVKNRWHGSLRRNMVYLASKSKSWEREPRREATMNQPYSTPQPNQGGYWLYLPSGHHIVGDVPQPAELKAAAALVAPSKDCLK
eukprot:m.16487 g.16487  ORF g.16487 m.16487 type:complete len:521 (-) comp5712_c0_seq1:144-1706(-)